MKKKFNFSIKNEKHLETAVQILILIISSFAISYVIHETNPDQETNEKNSIVDKLINFFNIIQSVSAQVSTTSYPAGASSGVTEQCCLRDNNGAICQSYSSNVINEICPLNQIFQGKCEDSSICQIGCCIDSDEGTCATKSTKGACESRGGIWKNDQNCNIQECRKGCCVLNENVQYSTEIRCDKLSLIYGVDENEDNFRQVSNELECLALAPEIAFENGACVFNDGNCKTTSLKDCANLGGDFNQGFLCSHPDLNTNCKKQDHIDCVDGKDEIYWFDSCGNRENIYSSDKDASWSGGKILNKAQSCNPNSANSNSPICGNCNYLLGSKCSAANVNTGKIEDGNFICQDLSCGASQETDGEQRENGESWCVYDSYIGEGKDTVGSRHWKRSCIDGKVQVEPCADFRGEICVQSDTDVGDDEKFSSAGCVINRAVECVNYNQDEKTVKEKCKENSHCQLTEVDVDSGFKFDVCTAKYPGGFDLIGENGRAVDSAKQLCSLANQKCTVIYVKKLFSGWECAANCDCETKKFSEEMNNLCIALGDCGSYINYIGEGTNNIKVKGAPKVSWTEYKKYAKLVEGQRADPDTIEDLKRIGFVSGEDPTQQESPLRFLGSSLGSFGIAAKLIAAAQVNSFLGGGISGFTNTPLRFLGNQYLFEGVLQGTPGATISAFGNFLGGAGVGAYMGSLVAKVFGLQGDAAIAVVVAGAIAGGFGGLGYLGGSAISSALAGISPAFGGLLAGGIIGLIAALVVAIVMKLLGVGKIKKVIVKFSCLPWQAPANGNSCESCNGNLLKPCTEYRCSSLGKACELINIDSSNPQCVSIKNDGKVPIITPKNISQGFKFENGNINGVEIRTENSACIPSFELLTFILETDERAQCKFDFESRTYDELEEYSLEETYYTKDHTFGFIAPSLESIQALGGDITGNVQQRFGNLQMYVKCQDVNGNTNTKDYIIDFCIASGPDQTAPRILTTNPINNAYLKQNTNQIDLTIFLNEPAECKYDLISGKNYNNITNIMNCNTDVNDPGIAGWTCNSTLQGLTNDDNKFYIKCRDQPWFANTENETKRNTNNEDYEYILHGTQNALKIDYTKPSGEIVDGVEPRTIELEIGTSGGINDGDSICKFGFIDYENSNIPLFDTGGNIHKQKGLQLLSGEYLIYVKCEDDAGNQALGNISFNLKLDRQAPIATRLFEESGRLKLITDENAECYYSLNNPSCNYNIKNATPMTTAFSKEHYANWNQGEILYIKCLDVFSNEPTQCTVKVSATKII